MIDISWDFKNIVEHIEEVKLEYNRVLASFSIFECSTKKDYIVSIRKEIYNLDIFEWQKDRLWEYLNDDETLDTLILIANRQKK